MNRCRPGRQPRGSRACSAACTRAFRRTPRPPKSGRGSRVGTGLRQRLSRTNRFVDLGELGRIHQPQVSDLHQPSPVEPQAFGLDVTVNHALVVGMPEPACRLQNIDAASRTSAADSCEPARPGSDVKMLHAEIRRALRRAKIKNLSQVGMIKLSGGVGLTGEPGNNGAFGSPYSDRPLSEN